MSLSLDTTVCGPTANSYADLSAAGSYFEGDRDLGQVWSGLDQDEQIRLLITAARTIDRGRWQGEPLSQARFKGYGLRQALAFPRHEHPHRFGQASGGGAEVLNDAALADKAAWPDDFFSGGAVLVISGPNQGLVRRVTGFSAAAGVLSVEAFPQAVEAGTSYFLIWPLDLRIVRACLEQAGHVHLAGAEGLSDLAARGLKSASVDGLSLSFDGRPTGELCFKARNLLRSFEAPGPRMERG